MIIFSRLGSKGNLGNQLFQVASTIGIALDNSREYGFPYWQYSQYFDYQFPSINYNLNYKEFKETKFNFSKKIFKDTPIDLNGWFQSEKYFESAGIKDKLRFKSHYSNRIYKSYKDIIDKEPIIISIRRGDFYRHKKYFQLDYWYYFSGIKSNFDDWKDRPLVFFSDDMVYCELYFSFFSNAIFLKNINPIEQLIFSSFCKDFVISNSTFSWWTAYLSQRLEKRVIRPKHNFSHKYSKELNDCDYFPVCWIKHEPELKLKKREDIPFVLYAETLDSFQFCTFYFEKLKSLMNRLIRKVKKVNSIFHLD